MLTIRLSKVGKKNKPMYRLVISEKARDPYGRALEILGFYNPHTKELKAKNERIKYWISKGSQMSPTVNNLLIEKGVVEGDKVKASKAKKKKKDSSKEKAVKKEDGKETAEAKTGEKAEKKEEINPPAGGEEKTTDTPEKPKEPSDTEAVEGKEGKKPEENK